MFFNEEVADIAQVHCNSELFEFELITSTPCINVKGNLRRNVEFFKCGKLCPFLTLVRGPFWPRFFTKLNCVVPVGLSFLSFLIKAVTLFFLIGRLFKCPSWLCPRQGVAYFTSVCM